MLTALFNINKILFEPFTVCSLTGIAIILAAFGKHKRKNLLFSWMAALVLAILWRVMIAVPSSRYASVLLVPAIVFSVVGIYALNLPKFLQRTAIGILVVFCLCKCLRFNENASYIRNVSNAVKADAIRYRTPLILDFCGEEKRLRRYAGLPVRRAVPDHVNQIVHANQIAANLPYWSLNHDVLYVVRKRHGSSAVPLEQSGVSEGEDWQMLLSEPMDRKGKKRIEVYRFLPNQKKHIVLKSMDDVKNHIIPQNLNLYRGADFSVSTDFFHAAGQRPPFWSPTDYMPLTDHNRMEFVDGKFHLKTLQMSGSQRIGIIRASSELFPLTKRYDLQVMVESKPGAKFFIWIYVYLNEGKTALTMPVLFEAADDELHLFTIPILPMPEYPEAKFKILIGLESGVVNWHNLALY